MTITDAKFMIDTAPKVIAVALLSIVVFSALSSVVYDLKNKKLNEKINQGKIR